ncbi:MAG: flippase-like domain-containing protein [Proteobacteria bacterium]|nr:flippase-like domain-containing protein [Pseudomonadota bacterium]
MKSGQSLLGLSGWTRRRSVLRGAILIFLTGLVFFLLYRQINFQMVLEQLKAIPVWVWLVATALTLTFPLMSAVRWSLMLKCMGFQVGPGRCLLITVGIWPLSSISPSKAGDFLKAFSLRNEIGPMVVAGSVVAERAIDVLMLSIFALAGGLYFEKTGISLIAGGIILLVVGALLFAKLNLVPAAGNKIQKKLRELTHSLRVLAQNPRVLLAVVLLTAANWFASILQTWLIFQALGSTVTLGFTASALPVAIFVGLLPLTIAGMGTRDGAMVYLFAAYATPSQAVAAALLYSFFGYWLLAVVGLPFMKKALHIK